MNNKLLYALRWQAAFVIYYPCTKYLGALWVTILAGVIGAAICYKIDQKLTQKTSGVNHENRN